MKSGDSAQGQHVQEREGSRKSLTGRQNELMVPPVRDHAEHDREHERRRPEHEVARLEDEEAECLERERKVVVRHARAHRQPATHHTSDPSATAERVVGHGIRGAPGDDEEHAHAADAPDQDVAREKADEAAQLERTEQEKRDT